MKIINMTPHQVNIVYTAETSCQYCGSGEYNPDCIECRGTGGPVPSTRTWRIPASGDVARVEMKQKLVSHIDGFPICTNTVNGNNLPEEKEDTYLLVSSMVLNALPGRKDLLAPDTNNAERNKQGHIVSVPGFISN